MSQSVDQDMRENVLRWASGITTDSRDPVAVVLNASVLLDWLEDATSPEDLSARHAALRQHYLNQAVMALEDGEAAPWSDNPAVFIEGAKVLYAFLASSPDSGHITGDWDDFLLDVPITPTDSPERRDS
jgi:hypothetical protein